MQEKQLLEKYKYMFNEHYFKAHERAKNKENFYRWGIFWGFACNEGWYPLLDELMTKLEQLDNEKLIDICQIKEKFGGLRFYIEFKEGYNEDHRNVIRETISEYESKTFKICEICGAPGKLCRDNYLLKTVCDEHMNYTRDDGRAFNFKEFKQKDQFHS